MKVKICGITSIEDALVSIEAGADMLGFNFYPKSQRFITPESCETITNSLTAHGSRATWVGVFVNAPLADIELTMERCGLHLAQLHGDEPPDLLKSLGARAFKAIRPENFSAAETALTLYPHRSAPPALLIDACHPGFYGGSGQAADWDLAARVSAHHPILLAGGLNPENVSEAVSRVHPWGVDVASGVELSPRQKDAAKIKSFIKAAHNIKEDLC